MRRQGPAGASNAAIGQDDTGAAVPTYEYRCSACGEAFEVVCAIAEREEKAVCPACGGHDVKQVFGPISFMGRRTELNPGHFERQKGKDPGPPRWVEPKR